MSGASTWQVIRRVEWPLVRTTALGALSLCFALSVSAFAIPAWIGAPERAYPLTYKIYQMVQMGGADGLREAAIYGLFLFGMTLPLLLLGWWLGRRGAREIVVTGKASRRNEMSLHGRSMFVFQAWFWASQIYFWVAPLCVMAAGTFVPPGCLQERGFTACLSKPSLHVYNYVLFELAETRAALEGSLVWGSIAAGIIVLLSLLTLMALSRRPKSLSAADAVMSVPLAVPGSLIALGLIVSASGRWGINLYNTPWIVVAAFVIKHINLAFQPLRLGLTSIAPALTEAARISGASPAGVWRRVLIPILRPELFGAISLVLIPILGELTMSIFLTSPSYRSIGTLLFDLQDYADQSSAAALSVLLVIMVLILNELARRLSRGRFGF